MEIDGDGRSDFLEIDGDGLGIIGDTMIGSDFIGRFGSDLLTRNEEIDVWVFEIGSFFGVILFEF